jgi:6,7-dimethyl-8-ribityllumazine synthase
VPQIHQGGPSGAGLRVAIVASRFNEIAVRPLLDGALGALARSGVAEADIRVAWVPGSFELPLAAQACAQRGDVDAVVCLGAVIRGDTAHFDYVAGGATNGVLRIGLDARKPVIFGVLTVDTLEQALARAGGHVGNKGAEAATTAVEMANLLRDLRA